MATVAERAREIADKMSHSLCADREERQQANAKLIEQALLAERRLARLEDAEIAHAKSVEWTDRVKTDEHTRGMADGADFVAMALRAAAEKEVGK